MRNYYNINFVLVISILFFIKCDDPPTVITTGSINGKIIDSNSSNPIEGVSITTLPKTTTQTSSKEGTYSYSIVDPGSYFIIAEKEGYGKNTIEIQVESREISNGDIQLELIPPELSVSVTSLDFGVSTTSLSLSISNNGKGSLNWELSENIDWLSVDNVSGSATTNSSSVTFSVNRDGLEVKSYSDKISVSSNGGSKDVDVKMIVEGELIILTSGLAEGKIGSEYSQTLDATGGTGEYVWSVFSGSLPSGINVSDGGIISGIPDGKGKFTFVIEVKSGFQQIVKEFGITILTINGFEEIEIGNQIWMAENLTFTHYRNGDAIQIADRGGSWANYEFGVYSAYDNYDGNISNFGYLYNWAAVVDSRNIAPEGWHVPTDEDWKELEMFLGLTQAEANNTGFRGRDQGGKLKELGTSNWKYPNTGATNESGFTALPGGFVKNDGKSDGIGGIAKFWTSTAKDNTSAWSRDLSYALTGIYRNSSDKHSGFSIRLVKDK